MTGVPDKAVAARRERVLALRASGLSFSKIAGQVGLPSPAHAAKDLERALDAQRRLDEDIAPLEHQLARERLSRLERYVQAALARAGADGNHAMVLQATSLLLRIHERQAAVVQAEPVTPEHRRAQRLGRVSG